MNQQYPQDPNQPFQPRFFPPQQPAPKKSHKVRNVLFVVGGIFALLMVIGIAASGGSSEDAAKTPAATATKSADVKATATTAPKTQPTAAKTQSPPATKTTAPKPVVTPKPSLTKSQEQAIGSAESYLNFTAFSRKGLIHQLSSDAGEGFSVADATYAADHIKVNWNEQAAKSARSYLEITHFSRQGLIHQLESSAGEGFTHRQAVYGVTKAGL